MSETRPASNLARTVVFAAFIAVLGIFPGFYLGGSAVPVVLQNTGPLLAGSVLGARRGSASVLLFLVLGVPVALGLIGLEGMVNLVSVISAVLPIVYFAVMLSSRQITQVERHRLIAYIPLFVATALFFLLFEQQPNTLANLAEADTDLTVFGYAIPASWFQSINSLAIIALSPLFAALWFKLGDRQPSTPRKFAGGLLFVGVAFLWVVLSKVLVGQDKHLPIMLALVFVIMTAGELMLSPVGLSASTKLAPAAFSSQTMGLYFLAPAAGQGLGAQVVKLYSAENEALYFGVIGLATVLCGVLLAVTQLTSTSEERMQQELLINATMPETVKKYAQNAKAAGLSGVVCSPLEAALVKEACGQDFLTVTPGIRFADGDVGDQVRVMTPAKARLGGSDYIVVGRPITAAADPVAAYERCVKEFLGE